MSHLEPLQGEPGKSGKRHLTIFYDQKWSNFFTRDKAQIPLSNMKKEGSKLV